MRILIVEDDEVLADALVALMRRDSHAVDHVVDGVGADEMIAVNSYDLVLLDRLLPGGTDGLQWVRAWRQAGHNMPILMLTAKGELSDRVDGLDSGADDYLAKPFAMEELQARVRSLLRRRDRPLASVRADDVELDPSSRVVRVAGKPIELAPKELAALEYLLSRVDETVPRGDLVERVWDDSFDAMSNVVDVLVYRLRKKIDGGRRRKLLHTVKGIGYRLSGRRH